MRVEALILTTKPTFMKGWVDETFERNMGKLYIDTTVHPYFKAGDVIPCQDIFIPYVPPAPKPK